MGRGGEGLGKLGGAGVIKAGLGWEGVGAGVMGV